MSAEMLNGQRWQAGCTELHSAGKSVLQGCSYLKTVLTSSGQNSQERLSLCIFIFPLQK